MVDLLFFFFKQKTAYEMRISDWSSDVCSSDLILEPGVTGGIGRGQVVDLNGGAIGQNDAPPDQQCPALAKGDHAVIAADQPRALRDQERAAGHRVVDVLGDRKSTRLNSSH